MWLLAPSCLLPSSGVYYVYINIVYVFCCHPALVEPSAFLHLF